MSVRTGQSITKVFSTRVFSTGVATNADSTPTGTLYVNGTADAASVTVTNITTGLYNAAVTLPTLAVGDIVDLRIAATVSSVTDTEVIWSDTKDLVIDSAGLADATTVKVGPSGSGTAQTARDIGASVLLSAGTGTGQLDFTTGVVKSNATQIAGSAVSTTSAQIGVNVVNVGGTVQTAGDIYSYLTTNIGALGASLSAIPKTGFKLASDGLAAITAWTVAITGNITGNLSGSIGSYTGNTPQTGDAFARLGLPSGASTAADIAAINAKTTNLPSDPADASDIAAAFATVNAAITALNNVSANDLFTAQMTEAYAADGTAPTLAQCLFLIQQSLHEFSISGTARTVKKLDGSTTAAVFTLDSATSPTSTTRTT